MALIQNKAPRGPLRRRSTSAGPGGSWGVVCLAASPDTAQTRANMKKAGIMAIQRPSNPRAPTSQTAMSGPTAKPIVPPKAKME